jgi:hypothetical protein
VYFHIFFSLVAISVLTNVDDDKYMLTLTDIKCFGLICIDQEGAGKECNKSQNVGSLEPSLTPSMRLTIVTLHQLNMISISHKEVAILYFNDVWKGSDTSHTHLSHELPVVAKIRTMDPPK